MIDEAPDDLALVDAARGGDRGALDLLLRRHAGRIHALCRRLTGDDEDAADATQEAMIAVVRGLDRFDGRSRFGTWVYRVATNACLDELRRRRRRPAPSDLADLDGRPVEGRVGHAGGLDGSVADRLDVDAALARVPVDFRVAVVLRDLCDLEYAEIAEVLQIPVGTVRSRIARGRAALVPLLATNTGNAAPAPERPSS